MRIRIPTFSIQPFTFAFAVANTMAVCVFASGCNGPAAHEPATQQQQESNFSAAPAAEPNTLVASTDWLGWRGPNRNGVVVDQTPVTDWSNDKNVIWKTKVPGRGHASPTVVGNLIVLATADKEQETQSVVAFDLQSGEKKWETVVSEGNFNPRIHRSNTHASSTVASDGSKLFVVFNNNELAQLASLDLDGNILWEKKAADFKPKNYQFGFGSSPILYNDTVIVTSECERDGMMVAFNKDSGEVVWRAKRDRATSYSTPVVANSGGKQQLILSGAKSTTSYDPTNGKELWSVPGPWTVTCGTAVWSDDLIFVSGGFPTSRTMAIKADGSEEIVWEHKAKCYEQSMLYHDGFVYGLSDNSVCYCWRAEDGEEMWKSRLNGKVSASPVLVAGNLYFTVEDGMTFVVKANSEKFELVAENQLGNTGFATATVVNNNLLLRVADGPQGDKQEWLYCIGNQ